MIGICGGMLSARFMGFFEMEISKLTAIAFFVPLIQATGGNVGIQSSSLVVQSLVNPGFVDEGLWKRLAKGFSVVLLIGFFLAVFVFAVSGVVFRTDGSNLVVSFALFFVVV